MPSTAVRSLFGAKKREQTVYTPQRIIDALLELWPEGIALDPCNGPESIVPAAESCCASDGAFVMVYEGGLAVRMDAPGGLGILWPARTYFNPPYNDLKPWLAKFAESWEVVGLVPVRPHRKWWRAAAREATDVCYLDPLKFVGHDNTLPTPLCALYRGSRPDEFRDAFAPLGGFLC